MTLLEIAADARRIARNFELFDTLAATQLRARAHKLAGEPTRGALDLHFACVEMWRTLAKKGGAAC
jgi:hypothetical protein